MATPTEIDYTKFGTSEPVFRSMLPNLFQKAMEHDELVAEIAVKSGEITEDDLEAARLRNKSGNADVKKINEALKTLEAKKAELQARAWELVEGDVPQPLNDEEKAKAQERVKNLRAEYKTTLSAVEVVAASVGIDFAKIGVELPSITQNGQRAGGTRTGHSGPRIRMDEVYVNGSLVQAPKPNKPEEMTSNLTVASNHINKEFKLKTTASDIQKAYFSAAGVTLDSEGGLDATKLPMELEFEFSAGEGDNSHTFTIKAKRS